MRKYKVEFKHAIKRPTNTTTHDIEYINVDGEWTFDESVDPFTYIRENYNVIGGISVTTYTEGSSGELIMSKELEVFNRTPPTVEEVCKALSERYNNAGIQYLKHNKSFVYGYILKPICWLKEDGTVYWGTNDLTPHLIILIGKFYEGVIHEQK